MNALPAALSVAAHPLLDLGCVHAELPADLGASVPPAALLELLCANARAPLRADDPVRTAVRDLLRQGGFKPTGRSKPASEYLLKAAHEDPQQRLRSINVAVDAGNAVSLHSGLPVSVVDAALASPPWRVAVAPAGATYVFNPSGQTLDLGGLLTLWDAAGPCAGPVKDSQRTKTHAATRELLCLVWGTRTLPGHTAGATAWLAALLTEAGATCRILHAVAEG
jgi:DNA/RNA-binding domain of Phe-tRNA-synthetase-like protein